MRTGKKSNKKNLAVKYSVVNNNTAENIHTQKSNVLNNI